MYAIKGIYDEGVIRFDAPVPVKEKYDVLITFLNPVNLNDQSKKEFGEKLADFFELYGAWEDERDPDTIIANITSVQNKKET
jgi:hypothetical protein